MGSSADNRDGSEERPNADTPLLAAYRRYFEVLPATTPAALESVHRLRYQVYVVENPFEDPNDHADGIERDAFDEHAAHCLLIHRPTGTPVCPLS